MMVRWRNCNLSYQARIIWPQSVDILIGVICGDRESRETMQAASGIFSGIPAPPCYLIGWSHEPQN
jgi:hypothetical protein